MLITKLTLIKLKQEGYLLIIIECIYVGNDIGLLQYCNFSLYYCILLYTYK
jgi:hypothetical protein